ncbi:50S ribosomal protein L22 [Candidatus Micrarchaeota archaeon]|nr:50S ribosomal protein L22 [Candidatus Micrarchaeota archaeon]
MSFYKYSLEFDPAKSGRSQGYDIDASYKDLAQACKAMEGRSVSAARKLLEEAIELKKPIRFYKFNKGMGHRSQLGGKKGKFPRKECRLLLKILANAYSNALSNGVEGKDAVVLHAIAYKQNAFPRYRRFFVSSHTIGYGKQAIRSDYVTARVEMVVGEKGTKRAPALTTAQKASLKKKMKQERNAAQEAMKKADEKKAGKKQETKAEPKSEAKNEEKAEVKRDTMREADSKHEAKQETGRESKSEVKHELKPEVKPETGLGLKLEVRAESGRESKPESKVEVKAELGHGQK